MAAITATDVQIKCYSDGTQNVPASGWNNASSGYYWVGKSSASNNVTVIKFTISSDADAVELALTNYSTVVTPCVMNYAIFSDENAEYNNATASTVGDGLLTLSSNAWGETNHRFFKRLSAGTHYIYLWGAANSGYASIYKPTVKYGVYDDFTGVISHKDYRDGVMYNNWRDLGTIYAVVGNNSSYSINNAVTVFRFVLPERAKNITFSACIYEANTSSAATMRYKIVSGAEDESMVNADVNTEADGAFTLDTISDWTRFSFTADKYIPKGVSYLYIWTNKEVETTNVLGIRCNAPSNTYGTQITYEAGSPVVYIGNGSGFDAYEVYVDNGTSWDLCEVYIDNGTSWDPVG